MTEYRSLLERAGSNAPSPDLQLERVLRRRDRKRRNQRIAAGVVGIAVFVAAIWIVTSVGSVDRTQTPAVPGAAETGPTPALSAGIRVPYLIDLNTGEQTLLPTSIAGVGGYSVSPDGTMVAYVSDDDEGAGQVYIASLDGTDVQQVTHTRPGGGLPDFPDWSPDGAAIAYVFPLEDTDRNIFVFDLATGETSQVTNEKPQGVGLGALHPRFSPDGASIVYWVNRLAVRSVPVTGGKSTLLVGGGKNDVWASFPTFSPDGTALAVACSGRSGRLGGICIADADGTNLRELVNDTPLYEPEWSPDGTRIAYTIRAADNDRVFVVDVATGETTFVDEAFGDDWLDDHTLIIEHTE